VRDKMGALYQTLESNNHRIGLFVNFHLQNVSKNIS
jgi:hypothetical protein